MYVDAAKIAENCKKGVGLKHQLYKSNIVKDKKNFGSITFLVQNCLKKLTEIDELIRDTGLIQKLTKKQIWLARIYVVELVLGRKSFNCRDKVAKIVYKFKKPIKELGSSRMKVELKEIPRYARVNTIKTDVQSVLNGLKESGLKILETPSNFEDFYSAVKALDPPEFLVDFHIPTLLVFHPSVKLFNHKLVMNGNLILQDKASCIVAPILNPSPDSVCLDMCAAPGLKTSHLATFLDKNGSIISIDKSEERYNDLKQVVSKHGLKNVTCLNQDAFCMDLGHIQPSDVNCIILDPPCSGSGIVSNYDYSDEPNKDPKRLQALHNLQAKLLKHALNNFPSAVKVVYSTCSLTEEENESVVEEVIKSSPGGFSLVKLPNIYKGLSPGKSDYSCGEYCLRFHPTHELTKGFFAALFQRENLTPAFLTKDESQLKSLEETPVKILLKSRNN